jgi:hypothetical protein
VERVGGCCLFAPGVKSKGNKNLKIKLVVALDGSRRAKHTQQPTEYTRERRGMDRIGQEGDQRKAQEGRYWIVLRAVKLGDKRE